jgi:hypothetical protein
MPSRHSRCSAGVEPRRAARHPVKNPLPEPFRQALASNAGSAPEQSRISQPAQVPVPAPLSAGATSPMFGDSRPTPRKAAQCDSTVASVQRPSPGTAPNSNLKSVSPLAVSLPCKMRIFYLSQFWGSLHLKRYPFCAHLRLDDQFGGEQALVLVLREMGAVDDVGDKLRAEGQGICCSRYSGPACRRR